MSRLSPNKNPIPARVLFFLGRKQWKIAFRVISNLLGGDLPCRDYGVLFLPHPFGITIRANCDIGRGCVIYQNVTIGASRDGDGPTVIGSGVLIGANAVVLGAIEIGDGATIGAGAVVTRSVPSCAVVVGNPARVLRVDRRQLE